MAKHYLGEFCDPGYSSLLTVHDLSVHTSLQAAAEWLVDAYHSNGGRRIDSLHTDGTRSDDFMPAVSQTCELRVYGPFTEPLGDLDPDDDSYANETLTDVGADVLRDGCPDRVIRFGPRMGVRIEHC